MYDEYIYPEESCERTLHREFNEVILRWVKKELSAGIKPNTKLFEIAVFNFKLIYGNCDKAKALREFLFQFQPKEVGGESDSLISRIQDLYIHIKMHFPQDFVAALAEAHMKTVKELGYEIGAVVPKYVWVMQSIQHTIRYLTDATELRGGSLAVSSKSGSVGKVR